MLPSYLEYLTPIELNTRSDKLNRILSSCTLCPRNCECDRTKGGYGVCRSTDKIIISSAGPHFGEEPPLSGIRGSGTIFFSSCNLKCQYCQNYDISQLKHGYSITVKELADYMMYLQEQGCHNINFVTPTHFVPQIVEAVAIASGKGLQIPLVYNCGGYESVETLKLLDGIIDIYMPDIKYSIDANAVKYSGAKNYWSVVRNAVLEMHRQVGDLKLSPGGIAQRGLVIRHLVLPNRVSGSKAVIDFIVKEVSAGSYVNIMDQYHPVYHAHRHNELNRCITYKEYYDVVDYARGIGLSI